jgi:uncharacterized hydrophobic protein (TIGR00271 family)
MLHVRVVCSPGSAGCLVERLAADPGVRNLVVLPGAARRPAGDAVQFDLVAASAYPVLRDLRGLSARHRGWVVIENVDAVITTPADQPARRRRWDSELAPGAIMATAYGLPRKDPRRVVVGLCALILGFAMASAATLSFGLIIRWSGHTPAAYRDGVRPVADFINSPNLFSVVVAVLADVVGVVSLTEARANALIGVFISVTTIPAAADMGLSAAYASWTQVRGSAVQLLANVVLLIAVGAAGLCVQRFIWRARLPPGGDARPGLAVLPGW